MTRRAASTFVRWLAIGLLLLLTLLAALVAAAWWWSGTPGSLQWALARFAAPAGVTATGVQGSLRRGLRAEQLQWSSEGVQLSARKVELAWDLLPLLSRQVHIEQLLADEVRVHTDPAPTPAPKPAAGPPASVQLPVPVRIDHFQIAQLQWQGQAAPLQLQALAGSYVYDGQQHALDLRHVTLPPGDPKLPQGQLAGHIRLGDRAPMPLQAQLQGELVAAVPGGAQALPLKVQASAQGVLSEFQLHAQVQAIDRGQAGAPPAPRPGAQAGARPKPQAGVQPMPQTGGGAGAPAANLSAVVTPWAPTPVRQAQVDLRQFSPAALWPKAPQAELSGTLDIAPAGADLWTVQANLGNRLPGAWDHHRLPFSTLRGVAEWRPGGPVLVKQFRAEVGGGVAEGTGQWEGDQGWRVKANVKGVDPAQVYTGLGTSPLTGQIVAHGQGEAVDFEVNLKASQATAQTQLASNILLPLPPGGEGGVRGWRASTLTPALSRTREREWDREWNRVMLLRVQQPVQPSETAPSPQQQWTELLKALRVTQLVGKASWSKGVLNLPDVEIRTSDARLKGHLRVNPKQRSLDGQLTLEAPGLHARFDGNIAPTEGKGTLQANASDLQRAIAWARTLPAVPKDSLPALTGEANLDLAWQGGWQDPTLQATLQAPRLTLPASADAKTAPPSFHDLHLKLDGSLAQAQVQLDTAIALSGQQLQLALRGQLQHEAPAWSLLARSLQVSASGIGASSQPWKLALQQPVTLRWNPGAALVVGPGQALLTAPAKASPSQAQIQWQETRWAPGGELATAGRASDLPLSWVQLFTGRDLLGPQLSGNLLFDAQWQLRLGEALQLHAVLQRSAGDLAVLAETDTGRTESLPAGIQTARLVLDNQGQQLTLQLAFESERAGSAHGQVSTRLEQGGALGWQLPPTAPLDGRIAVQLPRLRAWSLLAPAGWRVRGSLQVQLQVAGTVADPQLQGLITANDLAVRSVVEGVVLQNGQLRARLQGQQLAIEELLFHGAGAHPGTLRATGTAGLGPQGLQLRLDAVLDHLHASVRSDRELTVSGQAKAVVDSQAVTLTGDLHVDDGLIELPDQAAPALGEDVVVHDLPPGVVLRLPKGQGGGGKPVHLDVKIGLGDSLRVRGHGVQAGLRGQLVVSGEDIAQPQVNGTVRIVGGKFDAYGQKLDIERGILRFTGPATNPSLDILAIRPRLEERVGVQVGGTAQSPDIQLYSASAMTDAEKLSWLVLGRAAAAGGDQAALVQRAALAFLTQRATGLPGGGAGGGKGLAGVLGLDDLSLRQSETEGAAVTLGKRFADNLYASYERTLTGALGTLYVFYDISRRLTLRAETGDRSAVDLIYKFSYN